MEQCGSRGELEEDVVAPFIVDGTSLVSRTNLLSNCEMWTLMWICPVKKTSIRKGSLSRKKLV